MLIVIIMLLLAATGATSWFFDFNPFISFTISLFLGIALTICLIKWLAHIAVKSILAWTLLAGLFSYKLANNIGRKQIQHDFVFPVQEDDFHDIVSVLRGQMGFPSAQAREAAQYAVANNPKASLPEKIQDALRYLGNGHKSIASKE